MKINRLVALTSVSLPLIAHSGAHGAYTGLSVELYSTVVAGGLPRDVYRVYANFDDENDYLTSGAGTELLGPLSIQSRNADDTGMGTIFFNPGSGAAGQTPPSSPASPNYWGTYVTIGVSDLTQFPQAFGSTSDPMSLSPGFPNFINGNQLVSSNAAWFTAGPQEFGRAGFVGDGDLQLRVQLMQLSVNQGENVRGTLAIGIVEAGGLAGGVAIPNQTFNSIPAPSGLLMLGIGWIVSRGRAADVRRRRM
jgi:hypothetical protein